MKRLALYCLLLSGVLVQFATSVEETSRTPQFEPERKNRHRNGGGTRKPKQKIYAATFEETPRPLRGQLKQSYNPYSVKPAMSHGFTETGDSISLSGLSGGLQSTQLPPPQSSSGTTMAQSPPPRNSEFLKGKSKKTLRKFCRNINRTMFAQIEVLVV